VATVNPVTYVLGAGGEAMLLSSGSNNTLSSQSGAAILTMQDDGQICIWVFTNPVCKSAGCPREQQSCSGIPGVGSTSRYQLHVQGDGNLCIVDLTAGKSRWCARSVSAPAGPYHLLLANDGTACIHGGVYPVSNGTLWCAAAQGATELVQIPGAVRLNRTINVRVGGCSFRHLGGAGLDLLPGAQHSHVAGCYAVDVSGSGLQVGGTAPCPACPTCGASSKDGPCPAAWSPANTYNNTLEDNVVADVTVEYRGCTGVWAGYNANFTFSHNDICRVNYGGISLGWGWNIPTASVFNHGNELSYNHISEWLRVLADSGATYTLGPHPHSAVHHNYIHNGGSGIEPDGSAHGNGYYPDDGSTWWHIYSNVAAELHGGQWLFAWNPADEANLTVFDNYADTPAYLCRTKTCNFHNNTVVNTSAGEPWPAAAKAIMASAGARPTSTHPDARSACPAALARF